MHAGTHTGRVESFTDFNFPFVFVDHEMFCVLRTPGGHETARRGFLPSLLHYKNIYIKNIRATKTLTPGDKWLLFIIFVDLFTLFMIVCNTHPK